MSPFSPQTRAGWMPDQVRHDGENEAPSQPNNLRQRVAPQYKLHYNHSMKGYVYILASKRNGTLYTGVTSDLPRRLYEHQNNVTPGFTSTYGVKTLVWFEEFDLVIDAIAREKAIKNWPRKWKLELIEAMNPDWEDIAHYLLML